MKKYHLICYQQKYHERSNWMTANAVTDKDPGLWLAEVKKRHEDVAETILLSAVQISQSGYTAARDVV